MVSRLAQWGGNLKDFSKFLTYSQPKRTTYGREVQHGSEILSVRKELRKCVAFVLNKLFTPFHLSQDIQIDF